MKSVRVVSLAVCATILFPGGASLAQGNLFEGIAREMTREVLRQGLREERRTPRREAIPQPTVPSADIRQLQADLARLGYAPGAADGVMGPNTAAAIRRFQRDHGLSATGRPTPALANTVARVARSTHTTASPPPDPSFDCTRAASASERAICSSAALATRDRRLAAAYSDALARSANPARLRAAQGDWLAARDACGGGHACLMRVMDTRIAELEGFAIPRTASGLAQGATGGVDAMTDAATAALPRAREDVFLVLPPRWEEDYRGHNSVPMTYACMEPPEADALRTTLQDRLSARPILTKTESQISMIGGVLLFQGFGAMVAGDCLERLMYSLETDFDRDRAEFSVTRIALGTQAEVAPSGTAGGDTLAAATEIDIDRTVAPLARLYLPTYLAETPRAARVEHFAKYVQLLQSHGDHDANEIFAANEIEGRAPEFVANQMLPRWDAAIEALALAPPVDIATHIRIGRYDYDFEREVLTFPSYHEDDGSAQIFRGAREDAVYYPGRGHSFGDEAERRTLLEFVVREIAPSRPAIRSDRQVLLPTVPMSAQRAEQMMVNNDIVAADVAFRITGVGVSGQDRYTAEAAFLGLSLFTDAGEQLAMLGPDDMPPPERGTDTPESPEPTAEPEPAVPEHDARELAVAGVRLGMPLSDGIAAVREVGDIIYQADARPAEPGNAHGRYTLMLLDNRESFVLHTGAAPESPIIGLARRIEVDKGVPPDAVRSAFHETYGTPTVEEQDGGSAMNWRWEVANNTDSENVSCVRRFSNPFSGPKVEVEATVKDAERVAEVFDGAGNWIDRGDAAFLGYYLKDRVPRVNLGKAEGIEACSAFLDVRFQPSQTHPNTLRILLVDPDAFAREAVESEPEPVTFDPKL